MTEGDGHQEVGHPPPDADTAGAGGTGGAGGAALLPAGACLALVALGVGAVQRGGYFSTSRAILGVLAAATILFSLWGARAADGRVARALLLGGALIVGSAMLSAGSAGDLAGARPVALLVLLFAAGAMAASATPVAARGLLADGLLLVAVAVAASAWIGVVWRIRYWGYPIGGLWRGGSTFTYANAAAALLGMVFVLSVVRLAADPKANRLTALGTYAVGVGFATTLNRAGVLAVVVGLVVAAVLARPNRLWPVVARQLLAVGLGAAGVFPGLEETRSIFIPLSVGALLCGAAVALGVDRAWSRRTTGLAVGAVGLLALAALAVVGPALADGAARLGSARLAVGSDVRAEAWGAALDDFRSAPVVGVGPSTTSFVWSDDTGNWNIKYAHNEYLELLATQGLLGAAAAAAAAAALIRSGRGADLGGSAWLPAGALGGVAVFLVHCGFDFLFHIPGLALGAGLLCGLALPGGGNVMYRRCRAKD